MRRNRRTCNAALALFMVELPRPSPSCHFYKLGQENVVFSNSPHNKRRRHGGTIAELTLEPANDHNPLAVQLHATVTRKKAAGIEVALLVGLWFWLLNRASNSFRNSPARAFLSATSKAFMVGP
jgi:hypothetical protein